MSDSIYDRGAPRSRTFGPGPSSTVWQPVPVAPGTVSTHALVARPPASPSLAPDVEAAIIATLIRPTAPGETSAAGNARREAVLRTLVDGLTALEAFALGKRLDLARSDDALAQAFERIVVDRRVRLRAYLAEARRRAARGAR